MQINELDQVHLCCINRAINCWEDIIIWFNATLKAFYIYFILQDKTNLHDLKM